MSNKLYVGNLSYNANENDLESVFTQYGEVTETKVIVDRETNRSKGFGFVTFANADDAKTAMEATNETEFMGRQMRVSIAEEKPRNDRGGEFRNNNRNHDGPRGGRFA